MAHLTLAGRSDDGKRLLLVDDRGVEHTLTIDAPLRSVLRGEDVRIGQLEIRMESSLRPRDIQARIRAGETPEAVAQAAQTTVDRIMAFAAPVLAERSYVADRAQAASIRRPSGEPGARTLGEAVEAQLHSIDVDPVIVEWDSSRREDGRWTITGEFSTHTRSGTATFTFDARGNFVTMDDPDAKWLVGEVADQVRPEAAAGAGRSGQGRRLSAVPAEQELPLGEDTLSMVTDEELAAAEAEDSAEPVPTETTLDFGSESEPAAHAEPEPAPEPEPESEPESEPAPEPEPEPAPQPEPEAAPKPARKSRGRASVPSWDEIMFGGGKPE